MSAPLPTKYPFLEYAYVGDPQVTQEALFGSAIRALGKAWKVGVVSSAPLWTQLQQQLLDPTSLVLLSHTEDVPADLQLLLLDDLETDLQHSMRLHPGIRGKSHIMLTETDQTEDQVQDDMELDLISVFRSTHVFPEPEGQIYAITGNGKGKTTSALGKAISLAHGGNVAVVQWFKEKASGRLTWAINEHEFPSKLKQADAWQFFPTGAGFFGSPALDRVSGEEAAKIHRQKALEGLEKASELLKSDISVLVLDELLDTLQAVMPSLPSELLSFSEVVDLLCAAQKANIPVVITGRSVPESLRERLVASTTITSLRHPWADQKRGAVSGLDY